MDPVSAHAAGIPAMKRRASEAEAEAAALATVVVVVVNDSFHHLRRDVGACAVPCSSTGL